MGERIERIFVGWDRPLLHSLRDLLLKRSEWRRARLGAALDLSRVTVIVPGARAGRRLLELLVLGDAGTDLGAIVPPRVLTMGAWPALGIHPGRPVAGEAARLCGWAKALRSLDAVDRAAITHITEDDEVSATRWLGMARMLDASHAELSGECLRFGDVADRGRAVADFIDGPRWQALGRAQEQYERILEAAGLADAGLERIRVLDAGAVDAAALAGDGPVVLAGIAELNAAGRRTVEAVADRVVAVVCAPRTMASRFDEYGCVVPGAWESATLEIGEGAVMVAEGPEEQAATALRVIEGWAQSRERLAPDQIIVGVPDREVEERLRRLAGRLGNVPVRRAEGKPIAFTRPVRLLLGVADYLEERDFASMAALIRHPDVERWIVRRGRAKHGLPPVEVWLDVLDEYQSSHLHGRIDGRWHTEDARILGVLDALYAALEQLVGTPLLGSSPARACEWPVAIWNVLSEMYPDILGIRPGAGAVDPATQEACAVLHEHLRALRTLPASLCEGLELSAADAVRMVLRLAAGEAIPEAAEGAAIDLVGWLELAADDSPRAVVTGMNDGVVPSAPSVDPLLPEGLRRALGLSHHGSRLARDAYALGVVAGSRAPGNAVFIFGRRSTLGDPLTPSRLLLACEDRQLVTRVRMWTSGGDAPGAAAPLMVTTADHSRFNVSVRVLDAKALASKIDEMSVTSFRDYIRSPYGFYLKHVLRLDEPSDLGVEMDALGFGNLLHDVLSALSASEIAASTDADRIAAFLHSGLVEAARMTFGDDPRAEVALQVAQARERLSVFAAKQAARAAQGWRIAFTEWTPKERSARLVVDGAPMYLRGRIDRIDVRESDGAWAVLDYKTGNTPPEMRTALSREGVWLDPQLPLYRHLAAPLGLKGTPRLGWIALPRESAKCEFVEAQWTEEQLRSADEAAEKVVRSIRRGEFGEIGRDPPVDGIVGLLCGERESE